MGFLKRFGKTRNLLSRFHSRFGDISITAPNCGSWNQRPSSDTDGFSQLDIISSADGRPILRHPSKPKKNPRSSLIARLCLRDPGFQESSSDLTAARPTEQHRRWPGPHSRERQRSNDGTHQDGSDSSLPDRREGNRSRCSRPITPASHFRDDIPPSRNRSSSGRSATTERKVEVMGSPEEELPRRPPLSITSRMRSAASSNASTAPTVSSRQTTQSSAMSMGSNRTSPAMSSTSTGSVYPQTPKLMKIAYNPSFHTKCSRREKRERKTEKELVPSYDELYG
ncbi:hypothetical protein C8Q69DRAFT_169211 [Paecilomyces variotii]|uniref:Uncharacterized protein n=1 Tax=Byssochlamys spectabilis TaxID=264951 RepID=A0A443I2T3_BYSSP|nr:hypothetical protein C8Q69DRAFT_169211 [Paecilomyces variotii]RWQ98380.1 hypothetical protein C8Q69DRAFT_169211 [Paecilomyces variotii]